MQIQEGLRPIAVLALLAGAGCSQPASQTTDQVAQKPDETDLDCAALIYANANLLDDDTAGERPSFGGYLAAMTSYATAHASASGLDASEALGVVKRHAYRVAGTVPSDGDTVPHDDIRTRAKTCSDAVA